jgi:NAD(P)-dependent dehydrogenase (short-subunit alcohol dehydrogenase family)
VTAINPMDLTGRRFLITGASSGIGRETAILLSQLNARIVLAARNEERLQETLRRLDGEGHSTSCFDLTALDDIPRWFKALAEQFGPFDGLVHSAGIQSMLPLQVLSAQKVERMMSINVSAALMLAKAFRQKGCAASRSSLVLLSSVAGMVGEAGLTAYSASKAALMGLTKSLAMELAPENIRVNCVAPGMVRTEMMRRMTESIPPGQLPAVEARHLLGFGTPRDVAYAIAYLLADTGRWITGATLVVDGGYTAH